MNKTDKNNENRRSYFVTTKGRKILVEKMHLCSWLFQDARECLEVGLQLKYEREFMPPNGNVDLTLWMPWVKKEGSDKTEVHDLYDALIDRENCQFIFNEEAQGVESFEGQKDEDGKVVRFFNGDTLCMVKANPKSGDKRVDLSIKIPDDGGKTKIGNHLYVRILMEVPASHFSLRQKGISKTIYSYDVKVNEPRNQPDSNEFFIKQVCPVEMLFCLHIVPSNFSLSFLDHNAFKNVRILEKTSYEKYVKKAGSVLPANVKKGSLMVVFNKRGVSLVKEKDGDPLPIDRISIVPGSSFSVFEVDSVGYYQVVLAIILNFVCSMFFYLVAQRHGDKVVTWPLSKIGVAFLAVTAILALATWFMVRKQVKWWTFVIGCVSVVGILVLLANWVGA